ATGGRRERGGVFVDRVPRLGHDIKEANPIASVQPDRPCRVRGQVDDPSPAAVTIHTIRTAVDHTASPHPLALHTDDDAFRAPWEPTVRTHRRVLRDRLLVAGHVAARKRIARVSKLGRVSVIDADTEHGGEQKLYKELGDHKNLNRRGGWHVMQATKNQALSRR